MYIKINQRNYHLCDLIKRGLLAVFLVYAILPWRFASHYEYLTGPQIEDALVDQVTQNISLQQLPPCEYSETIAQNTPLYHSHYRTNVLRSEEIQPGGEYAPEECKARFSTAIIVPYRQRERQLHSFLTYLHNYLRRQRIHYRIFLVEQFDAKPFNRAKLFNVGAIIAAAEYGFPCLVLHDVDLLPLNAGQLYACSQQPRHMCSALDTFRFHLPYRGLFGGVVAILSEQFRAINGMSNMYEGWGGEDDDLYERLVGHSLAICRFAPAYSEYTMLRHKPEKPNENRGALLMSSHTRFNNDGLNSLVYEEKERRMHSLFTHILVTT